MQLFLVVMKMHIFNGLFFVTGPHAAFSRKWMTFLVEICRKELQEFYRLLQNVVYSQLSKISYCDTNNNDKVPPPELHKVRPRSEHPLAKAWLVDSAVGVIGIFFNSFELFVFYRERHHMINSVNVMIWSEHLQSRAHFMLD